MPWGAVRLCSIGLAVGCLLSAADPPVSGYSRAESLVRSSRWDEGVTLLTPLIRENPRDLKARNLLGIALTGKGDLPAANRQFEEVLRIEPGFLPALKNLGINEVTLNNFAAAEKHLTSAENLAPQDPVIHTYLGEIAYARQDWPGAAAEFSRGGETARRIPEIAPHLLEAYLRTGRKDSARQLATGLDRPGTPIRLRFQAGVVLAHNGLCREAVPLFEAVLEQFPDSYNTAFNLAVCYVETRQFSPAAKVLTAMAARGRKTAELSSLLGEAYEGNHQTQEAIDALREATRLAPEQEEGYLTLAGLCVDHRSYELALEVIDTGLHYRPQSGRLVFERGVVNAMLDRFELAEKDFQLAAQLQPESNLGYVGLGLAYIQRSDLPGAILVLRARVRAAPGDALLNYFLGDALLRSGADAGDPDFAEARAALEKSLQLDPGSAFAHVDLARIYLREERVEEAVAHLEKARILAPQNKSVYSHLAIAYRRQGKPQLLKAAVEQLRRLNDEDRAHSAAEFIRLVKTGEPAVLQP